MESQRIHRTASDDGTEIVGRVHGQGPPLVLVHGDLEDGDDWAPMLPHLSQRFTCYLMSRRGRGLSGDAPDHTTPRLLEDVTAFVDSVGEPVSVFGESGGGALVLGAAARTDLVSAVAVYEPVVFEVLDEPTGQRFADTFERAERAATEGRLEEALYGLAQLLANDDELAALSAAGDTEETGRYVRTFLDENMPALDDARRGRASAATDPSVLEQITAPVLLLRGSRTALHGWMSDGIDHVAEHVTDPHVRRIEGAGHFGVALEPQPIADRLIQFLRDPHPVMQS